MKITRNKFHFPFLFYLFTVIIFILVSCTPSTETSKGSLNGIINLEGESDHSGITIALYDLAALDPDIVSINQEYPQIGVHINQHTEFDHRFQSPVKYTETEADGSFELKKISTGKYNLVAIKDGWGFKYLYNVDISKGDNDLWQQINLYEEIHISGDIQGSVTVETGHHLIIDDNTVFRPNISSLIIHPGAVIRINPSADLTIYGILFAQGEENDMFWITSNDGFGEELTMQDSLQYYHQMELSQVASVEDDLIEWGKWDWGNFCLLNKVNNVSVQNSIFQNGRCGYEVVDVEEAYITKVITSRFDSEEYAGIYFYLTLGGNIEKCITVNCNNGIKLKDKSNVTISNVYSSLNGYGIKLMQCMGYVVYNEFKQNSISDIGFTGNHLIEDENLLINKNVFSSNTAITQFSLTGSSFNQYTIITTFKNNFENNYWYIYLLGEGLRENIVAENCYFDGLTAIENIKLKIWDFDDEETYPEVLILNVNQYKNSDVGIQ